MQRIDPPGGRLGATMRRSVFTTAVATAGVSLLCLAGFQLTGHEAAGAITHATSATGFTRPFSGSPRYAHLAPAEISEPRQLNQPIGQKLADAIARKLGLRKADTFTKRQFREFVTGRGIGGNAADAKLVDQSVRIFTNTTGRPLYSNIDGHRTAAVLASYGLFVNRSGQLESLANADAPTRKRTQ